MKIPKSMDIAIRVTDHTVNVLIDDNDEPLARGFSFGNSRDDKYKLDRIEFMVKSAIRSVVYKDEKEKE